MKTVLLSIVLLTGCSLTKQSTYTLYRNSMTDSNMRVHVATFDADYKGTYNQENCDIAQQLFQSQNGIKVKYWCEKGRQAPTPLIQRWPM